MALVMRSRRLTPDERTAIIKARRWYARNRNKVLLKRMARKGMGHGQAGEGNLDARQVGDLAL